MEVIGLNNKSYKWNPLNNKRVYSSCSTYHEKARKLIKELYPFDIIIEEVDLPGTSTASNATLRADFFIPKAMMLIEVHGEQHYTFSSIFHGNEAEFKRSKLKDDNKRRWCMLNNIKYVELPYNESEEEWQKRIQA
jgi:hypothetical protein